MKAKLLLPLLLLVIGFGCKTWKAEDYSPEAVAFKTLQTQDELVNAAMESWAEYAVLSGLTPEQRKPVADLHDGYSQAHMAVRGIVEDVRKGSRPAADLEIALAALEAAAKQLQNFILSQTIK